MRHSKLKVLTNSSLTTIVVLAMLCTSAAIANAGKRVVVMDFDGPQSDSFHSDVERVVKKSFTLVPTSKWNKAMESNEIERLSEKNVKMLCKKVGVDGVVSGKIEKRRDEYIVRIKLRECSSGEMVGNPIDVKATGPRLDGNAMRTLKEELTDAINALATGGGGSGGDDESDSDEDAGTKKNFGGKTKGKPSDDEASSEDEDSPIAKVKPKTAKEKAAEAKAEKAAAAKEKAEQAKAEKAEKAEREAQAKAGKSKGKKPAADEDSALDTPNRGKDDSEDEDSDRRDNSDEDDGSKKSAKKAKDKDSEDSEDSDGEPKKDDEDNDDEETSDDSEMGVLAPAKRAVSARLGMSFERRTLGFTSDSDLIRKPGGYKGGAPALRFDADIFPLAMGHKRKGFLTNIGVTVALDQVIGLKSKVNYQEAGAAKSASVPTTSQRYAVGAVLRIPFGDEATAPMVTIKARYGRKKFNLSSGGLPAGAIDVPNVNYTMIDPSLGLTYPVSEKLAVTVTGGGMLIINTGQIQSADYYGPAKVLGLNADLSIEFRITKAIFIAAGGQFSTFGFKFKGGATQSNMRDTDPEQDVTAARDSYVGGSATLGFAY
jgi:hypothetical protein